MDFHVPYHGYLGHRNLQCFQDNGASQGWLDPLQTGFYDLHKRVKTHRHLSAMLSHMCGDLLTLSQVSHWYVGRGVKRPLSANQILSLLCMCAACSLRRPPTPGSTCVVYTRTHTSTSGLAGGKADTQLTQ